MFDEEDYAFPWLSEEEYEKLIGQFRLQLNGVMNVFNVYGMGDYIPAAIEEIIGLVHQFGMRVRGDDRLIQIKRRVL